MFKFFLSCTVWSGSYYSKDLLLISKCVILYSLSFADVQICFCTVWVAALGYERDLFCKSKNMYDNINRTKTSSLAIQNRRFNKTTQSCFHSVQVALLD